MPYRIGVDLGGTKIEAVALDPSGAISLCRRVPTPRHDYHGTLQAIVDLVRTMEANLGARATVGVGTPGALSPATSRMMNCNSVWLNGRPFPDDLQALLDRPVRFENDANCFALSEARDGAGAGARVVFGVILGTGTGGGVAIHNSVWTGPNAIAGEWGHNPLPWPGPEELPGPPCYCGKHGCLETFLSGPGLARDFSATTDRALQAADIVRAAAGGDPEAEAALDRYEDRMARGLASVINVLDPDVIVLGGGMSNIERLYRNVPERWTRYVFSDRVTTPLRPPAHGDSSGARGAAWLWDLGFP